MSSITLYLVDDDEAACESLQFLLETYNISVEAYSNVDSFVRNFRRGVKNCVICDIRMPKMNGPELFKYIKTVDPELPFIFISGNADQHVQALTREPTVLGVLFKPFEINQLLKLLNHMQQAYKP